MSARTVNMETTVLRGVLKRYKLWGRLSDDFKALPEGKRGVGRALTDPEEKCLFDTAAQRPGWQVAYYAALLASNTTARGCELKALRLSDINLVEGTMTILRAGTKTDAGARSIPLNATARWAVARLIERVVAFGGGDPSNFLFPACESGSVDPSRPQTTWRTAWRNLTRAAGLPGFRFHDLRHHAITRLAEAGTPEQTLMALAGHVSREMMEHYSHVRQKAKREAVDLIDSYRPIEVEGDVAVAVH